ncbi:hypothetical protein Tco_0724296 [Tanacetum coccineum]
MTCDLCVEEVISVKGVPWVGDGGISGVSLSVVSSVDDKNGEIAGNSGIWSDDGSLDGSDSESDAGGVITRLRRERPRSPRHEYKNKERRESTVFKRLGSRGRSTSVHSDSRQESSRYTENYSESEDSEGGHWKSKLRRKKSNVEDDDLS